MMFLAGFCFGILGGACLGIMICALDPPFWKDTDDD